MLSAVVCFAAWSGPLLAEDVFRGACDASAAVYLPPNRVVVADDEDNILRVFDTAKPGSPVGSFDFGIHLGSPKNEVDIEAATRLGDRVYWITSHGRNTKGKSRPERHRLFATSVDMVGGDVRIELVGKPFAGLAAALVADPLLEALGLAAAVGGEAEDPDLAPEKRGLNIEGLAAAADGAQLLIALRNPRPGNKAMVVPLRNPLAVVESGTRPEFGEPVLLDLGHRGVRSIEYCEPCSAHLIVAGPHADGDDFALFRWAGGAKAELVRPFSGLTPESLVIDEPRNRALLLSDDGGVRVPVPPEPCHEDFEAGTCPCKRLADPQMKTFRGEWTDLPMSAVEP